MSKNECITFECKTCGKTMPISELEQHIKKEHFWN